jgi:hypothetical protein
MRLAGFRLHARRTRIDTIYTVLFVLELILNTHSSCDKIDLAIMLVWSSTALRIAAIECRHTTLDYVS